MRIHKHTKTMSRGSAEWDVTNVNRSNTICSNCISTNYYGINGGVRDGNILRSRSEW